jgi:tripartite-type tricarboxylate transporter receptor subunit TctC
MFARQEYGRPFLAPPGVPADRLKALRAAFQKVMTDPDFIKDAAKAHSEINPVTGEDLDKLTEQVMATSPAVIERVRKLLDPALMKK